MNNGINWTESIRTKIKQVSLLDTL
jgi:hypothetical protein